MSAYYNEIDPYAAATLRNLIAAGHIAPGVVDERSIEDVLPDELSGYTQCHFFAGFGVWSLALREAGWPDDRPVWTGSCPCQPFSAAGKGDGFADERHLWPAFYHLIAQCRPANILGEQVASKAVDPWIDLVHADLEALGYAFGSVPFPSAGVGAPHIRDRNYWVADSNSRKQSGITVIRGIESNRADTGRTKSIGELESCSDVCGLADTQQQHRGPQAAPADHGQPQANGPTDRAGGCGGVLGGLGDTHGESAGRDPRSPHAEKTEHGAGGGNSDRPRDAGGLLVAPQNPGPTNGHWRDADWLFCRDGKWRPVEPSTFPLAHGSPARVGRLRGYGNAINAKAAQAFIESVM